MSKPSHIHFYKPSEGHGLPHDPFNSIVGPRPIGWISTQDKQGVLNLAPYSFFNAFNYVPPIIGFASIGLKDSVRNVQETGEFCWNLVTFDLAEQMNQTCAAVGPEVDEFALAGLTPTPSVEISAPRVLESKVAFECKATQVFKLEAHGGAQTNTWMVFGEVVGVHIDNSLLVDGVYETARAQHILRGGGPADYFTLKPENLFKMHRP
jgi:flavin reductase (DIM6/NTAB) family NADH-FMN oxidoreductase RutF